jgi:hypothetical protein
MVCVGISSFAYSYHTNDFSWLGRSGSIITVLGILLTIKHSIFSESRDIKSVVKERNHYAVYAPDESSEAYKKHEAHAKLIIRDEYLGAAFTIVGTIIWGYGDLLVAVFT